MIKFQMNNYINLQKGNLMSVVTISREYGSGGREFGRLLANELGFTYADKEIAHELAGKTHLSEGYIEHFLDTGVPVGMPQSDEDGGFSYSFAQTQKNVNLQIETHNLLRQLAKDKDIVIVGRASDIILQDFEPFRIFLYAEIAAKIHRIQERDKEKSDLSVKNIEKIMKVMDTERYQHHALFSHVRWGEKIGYDLCINTTNVDIDKIVPAVAVYIKATLGTV